MHILSCQGYKASKIYTQSPQLESSNAASGCCEQPIILSKLYTLDSGCALRVRSGKWHDCL